MEKNYPINMNIPSAHFQIVCNECTDFEKKFMHPSLRTCVETIMSIDGRQTAHVS